MSEATPDDPASQSETRLEQIVHRIVGEIEHDAMSPGEVAELRRLDPEHPGGAAFWKAVVLHLEPAGQLRGADAEARWALVLRAVGELHGLNRPRRRLGRALAGAGVSEMRLARLLRADLGTLAGTLSAVSRQLASKAEAVDLADLAWLVLTARGPGGARRGEERVRRNIARDYYRGLRKAADDSTSDDSTPD